MHSVLNLLEERLKGSKSAYGEQPFHSECLLWFRHSGLDLTRVKYRFRFGGWVGKKRIRIWSSMWFVRRSSKCPIKSNSRTPLWNRRHSPTTEHKSLICWFLEALEWYVLIVTTPSTAANPSRRFCLLRFCLCSYEVEFTGGYDKFL